MKKFRAPGRVNLIGEHTDYNQGWVLPIAIDLACTVCASPRSDGRFRVTSLAFDETMEWAAASLPSKPSGHWSDYVVGIARQFRQQSVELIVDSSIPTGSGLSSSAALEVAVALALSGDDPPDKLELVRLTNRAEHHFIGIPCGIMDQYASLFGVDGHAILLDCRAESSRPIPLPRVSLVVVNTMVSHNLARSAYQDRVQECGADARALGVESLRDAAYSTKLPKRARHVTGENQRVLEFAAACEADDLADMGRLLVESHQSLRDDYEVSCEELDFLVERSLRLPGVWGARMTGGGFGGCIVALVEPGTESTFEQTIRDDYRARFAICPDVFRVRASGGAGEQTADSVREPGLAAH